MFLHNISKIETIGLSIVLIYFGILRIRESKVKESKANN